jgi:hypothetical protein
MAESVYPTEGGTQARKILGMFYCNNADHKLQSRNTYNCHPREGGDPVNKKERRETAHI